MKCDRCGKEMGIKEEIGDRVIFHSDIVGVSIDSHTDEMSDDDIENMKRQFGKYEINRSYNFCYECWLDSLMGVKQ